MNRIIHYCLIGLLVSSCAQFSSIDEKLPGKYVREKSDQYGSFKQELTIEKKEGQQENMFTVVSKTVKHRLDDNNKPLPAEEETETGTMMYNPDKKLLERQPNGNTYSVDFDKGIITNGTVTYTKVK